MTGFDLACAEFSAACKTAASWKHAFAGAAYRTRLDAAFASVKNAYEAACAADDKELERTKP